MNEYTGLNLAGLPNVTFPVSEEEGSYDEGITIDDWTPSVTLRCPWENRYDLVNVLNGARWPNALNNNGAPRATGFQIEGDGKPGDLVNSDTQVYSYIDALVTVSYEQVTVSTDPDPDTPFDFYTETIEPTIEYLRFPHQLLFWPAPAPPAGGIGPVGRPTPLSPEQTPGFPVYRERYTRTYIGITGIPAAFTDLQNHINTNPIPSPLLGITYPPRTILYGNRRISYNLKTDGTQSANLSLDFTYRQETWRKYWNFELQDFLEIQTLDGTPIAFPPEADLSPVLIN